MIVSAPQNLIEYEISSDPEGQRLMATAFGWDAALVAARTQIEDGEPEAFVWHPEHIYPAATAKPARHGGGAQLVYADAIARSLR